MSTIAEAASRAAFYIHHLPNGQKASLKRLMRDTTGHAVPTEAAYYYVIDRLDREDNALPDDPKARELAEVKWALLVSLMAFAPDSTTMEGSLGTELAYVDYSGSRLAKFIRTDPDSREFTRELRDIVTRLKGKGRRINWGDLATILLSTDPAEVASKRREVARDYYKHLTH
jgi:hypothetical protein